VLPRGFLKDVHDNARPGKERIKERLVDKENVRGRSEFPDVSERPFSARGNRQLGLFQSHAAYVGDQHRGWRGVGVEAGGLTRGEQRRFGIGFQKAAERAPAHHTLNFERSHEEPVSGRRQA